MNMRNHDMARICSTGFLTFLIFSVLLFGARNLVEIFLWDIIPNNPELVVRSPILEPGLDPNLEIVRHACIIAQMNKDKVYKTSFAFIDIEHYLRRFKVYDNPNGDLCLGNDSRLWYDTSKGLYYVYEWLPDEKEKPVQKEPVITYFGPKGAGEKPSRNLGRFHDPMASVMWAGRSIIVYDRHQPYFYRVDIKEHKVTKGPKLVNEARYIQLSRMEKTPKAIQLIRIPPYSCTV